MKQSNQDNSAIKLSEVAKMLNIGRNTLFKTLREKRVLNGSNVPRDRYIRRGYFKVDHRRYEDRANKEFRDYHVTLVTLAGQSFIAQAIQPDSTIGAVNNAR